jgi:hypothetical protein
LRKLLICWMLSAIWKENCGLDEQFYLEVLIGRVLLLPVNVVLQMCSSCILLHVDVTEKHVHRLYTHLLLRNYVRKYISFVFFSLFESGYFQFCGQECICVFKYIYACNTWAGIARSVERLATGWVVRGSKASRDEIFRTRPELPWDPPSLLYIG